MLFSHHIILNGLLDITEILFTTFITPPFIYGAIRIAIHVTGNIPNIYKNSCVFLLPLVAYSFPFKYTFSSNGDI